MIPTDKIRDLIGKGGATIRGIIEQTGAKIDVDDTGRVSVASSDAEGLKKALEIIGNITAVPEIGKVYLGKVVRLAEFGAFVELFPGTDGLLAHLRDRRASREGSEGRAARGRSGDGQGSGHRRQSHQAQPQGAHQGTEGQAGPICRATRCGRV
jgi:polyribonucleotide nucleotidyltransferase